MPHQFLYFADPMCSWCWGFSPVIGAVEKRCGDRVPVRVIMGGLYPGTIQILKEAAKETIREHWRHVHAASGQTFNHAFFDREEFVYDTEPASRAVVVVRRQRPELALSFLRYLHEAFYVRNQDITDAGVLRDLAGEFGVDRGAFARTYDDETSISQTQSDFAVSRQAGITGFPTLLAGGYTAGYTVITHGYQPWEILEGRIQNLESGGLNT